VSDWSTTTGSRIFRCGCAQGAIQQVYADAGQLTRAAVITEKSASYGPKGGTRNRYASQSGIERAQQGMAMRRPVLRRSARRAACPADSPVHRTITVAIDRR
jgi:hypothetical protein